MFCDTLPWEEGAGVAHGEGRVGGEGGDRGAERLGVRGRTEQNASYELFREWQGYGALALVGLGAWAAGRLWLGGSFEEAAAVWAYVQEVLAAADAILRAEEATYWAWSVLVLTLRMVVWISLSFLASARWIRSLREEGREATAEPALRHRTSETKADRPGTTSARL